MNSILRDKNTPLLQLVDAAKVREIVDSHGASYKAPWFGQLMTGPQLMAYLIQMNCWLTEYKVQLEL